MFDEYSGGSIGGEGEGNGLPPEPHTGGGGGEGNDPPPGQNSGGLQVETDLASQGGPANLSAMPTDLPPAPVGPEQPQGTPPPRDVTNLNAGRDLNYNLNQYISTAGTADSRKPEMIVLPPEDLARVQQVFVAPEGFEDSVSKRLSDDEAISSPAERQRVFVITGAEGRGKLTAAVALAQRLEQRDHEQDWLLEGQHLSVNRYHFRDGVRLTLNQIVRHADFPQDSVVIIDEVFKSGINASETDLLNRDQLRDLLNRHRSYLILTSSAEEGAFRGVRPVTIDQVNLSYVFDSHLDYHFDESFPDQTRDVLIAQKDRLVQEFEGLRLAQISSFFQQCEDKYPTHPEAIDAIVEAVLRPNRRTATHWFRELSLNQRLFAMLAVLFHDVTVYTLDDIYTLCVAVLRQEEGLRVEAAFRDVRRLSLEEMLEATQIQRQISGKVEFINTLYSDEVKRQVAQHQRLLWSLEQVFREICTDPSFDSWTTNAVARALGQIGMYHPERLRSTLDRWVMSNPPARAYEAVAAILGYVAEQDDSVHREVARTLVKDWVMNQHPFRVRAAAAAIGHVFSATATRLSESMADRATIEAELEQIQETLGELSEAYDAFTDAESPHFKQFAAQVRQELVENGTITLEDGQDLSIKALRSVLQEQNDRESRRQISALDEALDERAAALTSDQIMRPMVYQVLEAMKSSIVTMAAGHTERTVAIVADWLSLGQHGKPLWRLARVVAIKLFKDSIGKRDEQGPAVRDRGEQQPAQSTEDVSTGEAAADNADNGEAAEAADTQQESRPAIDAAPRDDLDDSASQPVRDDNFIFDTRYMPLLDLLPGLLKASSAEEVGQDQATLFRAVLGAGRGTSGIDQAHLNAMFNTLYLNEVPIRSALDAIYAWYDPNIEADLQDAWTTNVYRKLLATVNTARQRMRGVLRDALKTWVTSEIDIIYRIGHAVIARSYVMDGVVTDLPRDRYGVLIVETEPDPRRAYRDGAFTILQHLITFTPMQVYHLSTGQPVRRVGEYDPERVESPLKWTDILRGQKRPRLLLPTLERPPGQVALDPEQCHFIVVLNQRQLIDLPDLLLLAAEGLEKPEEEDGDPFARAIQAGQAESDAPEQPADWHDPFAALAQDQVLAEEADDEATGTLETIEDDGGLIADEERWPWWGKVFVYSPNPFELRQGLQLPQAAHDAVRLLSLKSASGTAISSFWTDNQRLIQDRIIDTLGRLPLDRWTQDLAEYQTLPDFEPPDYAPLYDHLDGWVLRLNDETEAQHPKDITLSITWTVLWLSRLDMAAAVERVQSWLEAAIEDRDNLDDPGWLRRNMGAACTRLLFNFYGAAAIDSPVTTCEPLLRLLVPFMRHNNHHDESAPVVEALFNWAISPAWADRLLASPDGGGTAEILEGFQFVREEEDISAALQYLARFEAMERLFDLYERIADDVAFLTYANGIYALVEAMAKENEKRPAQRRPQDWLNTLGDAPLPFLNPAQTETFYATVTMLPSIEQARRTLLFLYNRLGSHPSSADRQRLQVEMAQRRRVIDAVRIPLYSRREDVLPPLRQGQRYGLLLVDIAGEARQNIVGAAHRWLKEWAELGGIEDIVLTVHRLGRKAVLSAVTGQAVPQPGEICPPDLPHYAPFIGPILERYEAHPVAFVVIVTRDRTRVLDLDDWREDPQWGQRLWPRELVSLPQASTGTRPLDAYRQEENTQDFVAQLIKQVEGE